MASDPVALFRCRKCDAWLFERDCAGHLLRHGVDVATLTPGRVLAHFHRGPKTAAPHPGENVKPMYHTAKGRKRVTGRDKQGAGAELAAEHEDEFN